MKKFAFIAINLLFLAALCLAVAGCYSIPANPTPTDIQKAQQAVVTQQLAFLAATTPVDIEIANGKIKGTTAQAIQSLEASVAKALENAYQSASAGQPVDQQALVQLLIDFKAKLVQLKAQG